jgi:hypothetical protein
VRHRTSYRDLNGDGFEDAVVVDPYATVNGQTEAGTVTVLFGGDDRRIGEGARQTLTQADLGNTPGGRRPHRLVGGIARTK